MTQTPLDRLALVASWYAFFHAVFVASIFAMNKVGFEQGLRFAEWYIMEVYGGSGFVVWWLSPILWFILWITTGSYRFPPWKHK